MSIRLIREETEAPFLPAVVLHKETPIDAKFFKCPESGKIVVLVEEFDEFPFNEVVKLVVKDGNDSYYNGVFDKDGEFVPL